MPTPNSWEWVIILAIVLLLFGAKRLPDAARGLGRSLRILKAETKGLHDEPEAPVATTPPAQTVVAPPVLPAALPGSGAAGGSVDLTDPVTGPVPQPQPPTPPRPTA